MLPKFLSVLRGLGPLSYFLLFCSAVSILSILDFSQSGRRVQVRWLWLIQPNLGWSGLKVIFALLKTTFIFNILILSCNPPGSSLYGVFQARILEWVAIFFFILMFLEKPFLRLPYGPCRVPGVMRSINISLP